MSMDTAPSRHPLDRAQSILSSIPGHCSTDAPLYEQSTTFSPFVFEKDINPMFRPYLKPQESTLVDTTVDLSQRVSATNQCQSVCDIQHPSTPSLACNEDLYMSLLPSLSPSSPGNTQSPQSLANSSPIDSSSDSPSSAYCSSFSPNSSPRLSSSPSSNTPQLQDYQCPQCPASFPLQGGLRKHWYRRHEKRFVCTAENCSAAFHLKADLKRHTESKHSGQAIRVRIECSVSGCVETFTRRDNMLRHVREEHANYVRRRGGG